MFLLYQVTEPSGSYSPRKYYEDFERSGSVPVYDESASFANDGSFPQVLPMTRKSFSFWFKFYLHSVLELSYTIDDDI